MKLFGLLLAVAIFSGCMDKEDITEAEYQRFSDFIDCNQFLSQEDCEEVYYPEED